FVCFVTNLTSLFFIFYFMFIVFFVCFVTNLTSLFFIFYFYLKNILVNEEFYISINRILNLVNCIIKYIRHLLISMKMSYGNPLYMGVAPYICVNGSLENIQGSYTLDV